MLKQLELLKPTPPGPPKDRNIPLLLSLCILLVGLALVFSCAWYSSITALSSKCMGPGMVMAGIAATLLRILFSYTPTCLVRSSKVSAENIQRKQGKLTPSCKEDYSYFSMKQQKANQNDELVISISNFD